MKKLFACLMACMFLLSGCRNAAPTETKDGVVGKTEALVSDPVESEKETGALVSDPAEKKEETYREDQALFFAANRCDVEGDRGKLYYYNYKGKLLTEYDEEGNIIPYYGEVGLAPAWDLTSELYGYVDRDGVFQIEPQFTNASLFSDAGLALVQMEVEIDGKQRERVGYIDSKGNLAVDCIYVQGSGFYPCGYASATKETDDMYETHILDEKGEIIFQLKYYPYELYKDYFVSFGNDFYNYKGEIIAEYEASPKEGFVYEYEYREDAAYRYLYQGRGISESLEGMGEGRLVKIEKFDGKKFVEQKLDYQLFSKHVATAISGFGWGVEAEGKTVIPFEYDCIYKDESYFICLKIGEDWSCQTDIYNEKYEKTAENAPYLCLPSSRTLEMANSVKMPNGYFLIQSEDSQEGEVYGVIDYKGNIIVEPVFSGVSVCSYEEFKFKMHE